MAPAETVEKGDLRLVQIVDAALADATLRSGEWLACRPGCSHCCMGVFAISQLDALRLRRGLEALSVADPARAEAVRARARAAVARLAGAFPGDPATGVLGEDETMQERFEEFANDEPCPVLSADGTCDLYASRPLTCRAFGPPVRSEGGLGVCELCFQGASEEEIAACEMAVDPDDLEGALLAELEAAGVSGRTIVAFALAG